MMSDLRVAWICCDPPSPPGAGTWELVFLDGVLVSRGLAEETPPGPGPIFLQDGMTWSALCRAVREAPGLLFAYRLHADLQAPALNTVDPDGAYSRLSLLLDLYKPDPSLGIPSEALLTRGWRLTPWEIEGESLVRWWERPVPPGHVPARRLAGLLECVVPGFGPYRCFTAYTQRGRKLDGYAMPVPILVAMRRVDGFLARHQQAVDASPSTQEA